MKRLLLALTLILFTSISFAQSPEAIKYQAVARDANGDVYANTNVSMRISVLETSTTGPAVYVETHSVTSNDYGLINLEIGTGTPVTGTFAAIDWGSDLHYVKVEIDPAGGNNYEVMGTSQMLSVPYALYAENAGNTDDADSDPTNELITNAQLNGAGLEIEEAGNVQTVDLSSLINDNDANPGNELINNVSYQNDTITITEAGIDHIIDLTGLQDNDSDSTNEIQDLQLAGNILTITDNSSATAIDLSPYLDNTDQQSLSISNTGTVFTVTIANGNSISFDVADNDNDPTNEIQSLSKTGNQISLSNGGGTITDDVDDADNDPANESLTNATLNSTDLEITESGNLTTVDMSSLVDDADADPNNEIQTISKTGNQISLSNGGGTVTDDVDDADADPSNEFQTISKSGNTVTLSDGGGSFTDDVDDADADPANESLTNATLNLTDLEITESGNLTTVDLSSLVDDADADPSNESVTNFVLNGNTLELTESGNLNTVDLSSLSDADADPTNEIQDLSLTNDTLTITNNASATDISLLNYKPLWEVNGSGDKYTFDRVGINTNSPGFPFEIEDTLSSSRNRSLNISTVSSSSSGSGAANSQSALYINMSGSNSSYSGIKSISNGNATRNFGGFFDANNSTNTNTGIYVTSGFGGVQATTSYGTFTKAGNATNLNIGLVGQADGTAGLNVGVGGQINGNTGAGSNYAFYGFGDESGSGDNYGIYLIAENSTGTNYGVYADAPGSTGTSFAGYFDGDVEITGDLNVTGNISKGGGTFKIDHPQDPTNKYLVHSFVESPEMMNVYNGNIETDANGYATVELPEYFESANKDFRYQLTVIGSFAQAIVKEKISDNKFIIQTDQPNVEVSWQVTGIRNDPYAQKNRIKPVQEKPVQHKGTYLHPDAYDADESRSQHEKYGPDKDKQRKAQKQIEKDLSDK
ncbi:autotransporter outer membrane beta-barrel domain-containing protein [Salibacter halophilus]|uniref:Uncharacterized protein n=1 Tax=Salibacter halophilus TaxID=1803916 RepID=A0A6N6M3P8_9FLAO|nr:hypothetical protein [Salibacter halophilus]KAB1063775.1 hypothetical protein F3059_09410 [Salibacter halophilus]